MSWRTVETELLKIITDAVPSTVKVMTADDVAELVDRNQFAPSVQLLYMGLTVQDQNAKAVAVTYKFDIAVCMRSASITGLSVTCTLITAMIAPRSQNGSRHSGHQTCRHRQGHAQMPQCRLTG